ncbi:putative transporter small subunit [Roseovarius sp. 2305UL8-3]
MLATYILIWPVISAIVLAVIVLAFVKDLKAARKDGDRMV